MTTISKTTAIQPRECESLEKVQNKAVKQKNKKEKDLFIDTPLRKLGFLDEFGEALRPILTLSKNPIVKKLPNFAYIPSTMYMVADVADKYQKGEDGTGQKPSAKMAAREALYQGVTSIAAPIAIIRGTQKFTNNLFNCAPKAPKFLSKAAKNAGKLLEKNKFTAKLVAKAGMPGKIAGAAISIIALSRLSKPVDWAAKKVFNHVVDPILGIKKTPEEV